MDKYLSPSQQPQPRNQNMAALLSWLHPKHAPRLHLTAMSVLFILTLALTLLPTDKAISALEVSSLEIGPAITSYDDKYGPEKSVITKSKENPITQTKTPPQDWQRLKIKSGDTLSTLFKQVGLNDTAVYEIINSSKAAKQLVKIKPGQELAFLFNDQQQLQKLRLTRSKVQALELHRTNSGFQLEEKNQKPDVTYAFAEGVIDSSLFGSANQAGLSDNLTMELAAIFGWDIDFVLDIRNGDSFAVVYEELFLKGEKIGVGNIVSAEFTNQGQRYQAVRYKHSDGSSHYFTPEGNTMRKEFLRSPVDFARISSHFNLKRRHPVLHSIRAHKGTDYAAARGTPIKAAGDGKVIHAARKGGYGKAVIIKHGQTYQTLYAHLNQYGRGIKSGTRVKQGQIIGYVGSTGLATGPHLHYEFYVNGAVRNPVTVKLPKADAIPAAEKPRFLAQTQRHMMQLASYTHQPYPTQVALAGE